jgi:uncharacterized iron-regulated protein
MRPGLLLFALLALVGCATASLTLRDHPLAGRIWDPRHERFVTAAQAEAIITRADYALLGETHDNPEHHEIQARLLDIASQRAPRPALAMEQIDLEWQAAVDAAREKGATAAAIAEAGHIAASWQWRRYEPLIAFALASGERIIAANYSRARSRDVMERGIDALGAAESRRLAIAEAWSPERNAKLRALIVEGHCGQDDPIVDSVVKVQRVRDAMMADAILEAPRTVAVIGRGHARADVGVPLYLAQRAPGKRVISLGLVEVEDGKDSPQDYPDAAPGTHDLVWFTARAGRTDPCASFKPIHR